ncbi:MAG: ASCH domain-containing protein [Clostridiales Family XIII bacterium]|jgi:hypothetical protein|nr:ASCH domain-containing protein [Clostridiales Family XIII bacterium]
MKALSIRGAYIIDIMKGAKTIEYRTWQTPYRGDLLLVSSSNPHVEYQNPADGKWYGASMRGLFPLGQAMCVIHLTDCEKHGDEYHWLFDNVRFVKPFPVKGKLHLYDVEEEPEYIQSFGDLVRIWASEGLIEDDPETAADLIRINSIEDIISFPGSMD